MVSYEGSRRSRRSWIAALGIVTALGFTGCAIEQNGQLLPNPYYLDDDIQYYAPGPEFKLQREADALKAAAAEAALQEMGAAPRSAPQAPVAPPPPAAPVGPAPGGPMP